MGISYNVIPFKKDEGFIDWLSKDCNIVIPSNLKEGRYPTPQEIRNVIENLEGYKTKYLKTTTHWHATVESDINPIWVAITIYNFDGNENKAHQFYFERGWPELVTQISQKLSVVCGSLVVLYNGELPALITPNITFEEVVGFWKHPKVV